MIFKASLDKRTKYITAFLIVIVCFACYLPFFLENFDKFKTSNYFILSLPILIFSICYYFRPFSYEINSSEIIVNRLYDKVVYKQSEIKEVFILDKKRLSNSIRSFANGGFFGFYGSFYNKEFGDMTWYGTKTDGYVMVIFNKSKIVLTPDETSKFIENLKQFKK